MTGLKAYVEAWLQKAENDIVTAQRLLDIQPMILDNACFHCQQAAEKSLKAFLCFKEKEIVRTHDIVFLLAECAALDSVFDSIDPLNMNEYAVGARYPDFSLLPEPDDARKLYELAVRINDVVKERIVFLNS